MKGWGQRFGLVGGQEVIPQGICAGMERKRFNVWNGGEILTERRASEFSVVLWCRRSRILVKLQIVWSWLSGTSRCQSFICRVGAHRKWPYAREQDKAMESMVEAMAVALGSDSVSLFKVMRYHLIRMHCVSLLTYGSLLMLSLFASICYLEQKESILGGLLTTPASKLHVSQAGNILTATVNMNSPVRTTTGTKEE